MTEYVTIKEFCKMAKISPQSVYKRLKKDDNPLNNYIKLVENKKMINLEALKLYQTVEIEPEQIAERVETTEENEISKELIELLRKELEDKSEQLRVKDKQIEDLNERLSESMQALNQQQHLNAIAEQKILSLENKEAFVEGNKKKPWWKFF